MPKRRLHFLLASLVIGITYLFFGTYRLIEIPGEWYGDISIVHHYVQSIIHFVWPWSFTASTGPLYHYLIALPIFFGGSSYFMYKLCSVCVGLFGLYMMYLFARAFWNNAVFVFSVVFSTACMAWYITWARLGNSQILIPALIAALGYALIQFFRTPKTKWLIAGACIAGLGLFVYPQTFILPIYFTIGIIMIAWQKKTPIRTLGKELVKLCILFIPFLFIFALMVFSQPDNFTVGYVGTKLPWSTHEPIGTLIVRSAQYFFRTMGMFFYKGDVIFRNNVESAPMIDGASRILFVIGMGVLAYLQQWRRLGFIVWSICLLILPSISPTLPSIEIPNGARTIGVIPFVVFGIGFGVAYIYAFVAKHTKIAAVVVVSILLCDIAILNFHRYFIAYPKGLPNQNKAYSAVIARYIDTHFSDIPAIYFAQTGWEPWGVPESESVIYSSVYRSRYWSTNIIRDCHDITHIPAVVVYSPRMQYQQNAEFFCSSSEQFYPIFLDDVLIASVLYIPFR